MPFRAVDDTGWLRTYTEPSRAQYILEIRQSTRLLYKPSTRPQDTYDREWGSRPCDLDRCEWISVWARERHAES